MDCTNSKRTSVPCPCPACDGRRVTKYVRRNHLKAFVALNTDILVDETLVNREHCDRKSECTKKLEEDVSVHSEIESEKSENSCYRHTHEAYDVDNCDTGVTVNCKESEQEATNSDDIEVDLVESGEDENEEV